MPAPRLSQQPPPGGDAGPDRLWQPAAPRPARADPQPPGSGVPGAPGQTGLAWPAPQDASAHADWALGVLAVDPAGLGGLRLRGDPGPLQDRLVSTLRGLLPPDNPCLRLPLHVDDHRLFGGLDLAATLAAGRPRYQPGLLSAAAGGLMLLPQSPALPVARAAALAAALDRAQGAADPASACGQHAGARGECQGEVPAAEPLLLVALDEPLPGGDGALAPVLAERLALVLDLSALHLAERPARVGPPPLALQQGWPAVQQARARLRTLTCPAALQQALAEAAEVLGVAGLRPLLHTLRAARAASALQGEAEVSPQAMALALRLVLVPHASRLPAPAEPALASEPAPEPEPAPAPETAQTPEAAAGQNPAADAPASGVPRAADAAAAAAPPPGLPGTAPPAQPGPSVDSDSLSPADQQALAEQVLQAAVAALPPALLAQLAAGAPAGPARPGAGALGASARPKRSAQGRPLGPRRGDPRHGARLHLLATLRAAVPWQALRQRSAPDDSGSPAAGLGKHAQAAGAGGTAPHPSGVLATAVSAVGAASKPSPRAAQAGDPAHPVHTGHATAMDPSGPGTTPPAGWPRPERARLQVRREDFHVWRVRERQAMLTLFVVDASGSAAMHRLAEAKGAVELLLADCYVRRDQVALVSFRGAPAQASPAQARPAGAAAVGALLPGALDAHTPPAGSPLVGSPPAGNPLVGNPLVGHPLAGHPLAGAQLLLPPTRALARARACLAALPGGGATPLADGLCLAERLVQEQRRRGLAVNVVLLSDGRANLDLRGRADRASAMADALAAAGRWPGQGAAVLWLDTAPQPGPQARQLAAAMGARYLPLPHADARQVAHVVRAAALAVG